MPILIDDTPRKEGEWPEGQWGEPVKGCRIKVRRVDSDILEELRKPLTKTSMDLDRKTRQVRPVETVDSQAYDDAIKDYLIEDFEGFVRANGLELPKTLQSKKELMKQTLIAEWVWSFANSLQLVEVEVREEEEKNS
jgi:hypothetical protein